MGVGQFEKSGQHGKLCSSGIVSSQRLSLVVVAHAVDVAVMIDGEGNSVQSLGANHAAETAGVVRVAQGLQDLGGVGRGGRSNQQ